jgi:hypothetical protein
MPGPDIGRVPGTAPRTRCGHRGTGADPFGSDEFPMTMLKTTDSWASLSNPRRRWCHGNAHHPRPVRDGRRAGPSAAPGALADGRGDADLGDEPVRARALGEWRRGPVPAGCRRRHAHDAGPLDRPRVGEPAVPGAADGPRTVFERGFGRDGITRPAASSGSGRSGCCWRTWCSSPPGTRSRRTPTCSCRPGTSSGTTPACCSRQPARDC